MGTPSDCLLRPFDITSCSWTLIVALRSCTIAVSDLFCPFLAQDTLSAVPFWSLDSFLVRNGI